MGDGGSGIFGEERRVGEWMAVSGEKGEAEMAGEAKPYPYPSSRQRHSHTDLVATYADCIYGVRSVS